MRPRWQRSVDATGLPRSICAPRITALYQSLAARPGGILELQSITRPRPPRGRGGPKMRGQDGRAPGWSPAGAGVACCAVGTWTPLFSPLPVRRASGCWPSAMRRPSALSCRVVDVEAWCTWCRQPAGGGKPRRLHLRNRRQAKNRALLRSEYPRTSAPFPPKPLLCLPVSRWLPHP